MKYYPCHSFDPCEECRGLEELAKEIPSPFGEQVGAPCDACAFQIYEAERDLLSLL